MGVKVTKPGLTVSRVVARHTVNGREFPIRKSTVAEVDEVFSDDEVGETIVGFAKDGERGFEYVNDSPVQVGEDDDDDKPEDYTGSDWNKESLLAEIEERNADREDDKKIVPVRADGKEGDPLVSDLQAALVDDDKEQATA